MLSIVVNLLWFLSEVIRHIGTAVEMGIASCRGSSFLRFFHLAHLAAPLLRLDAPQLLLEEALHVGGEGGGEVAAEARVHAPFPLNNLDFVI